MQVILKTITTPVLAKKQKISAKVSTKQNIKQITRKALKIEKLHYTQECKNLAEDLRDCCFRIEQNEVLFNLETEPLLVDQRIYERNALLCRYQYLIKRAKILKLRVGALNHEAIL